jgi:alpha-tubulin suppressor-like RCC1 family protein
MAVSAFAGCDEVFGLHGVTDAGPPPPPVSRWAQIAAGTTSSCGIRLDHTLWCWGRNDVGQLGLGAPDPVGHREPTQVGTDANWTSVSVTVSTACAIKQDQTLWCWGDNSGGEVGNGMSGMQVGAPVPIAGTWKMVAVGEDHACGIQADDSLWCWGDGSDGRLGFGDTTAALTPKQLVGSTWKTVSTALHSTCGIQSDDTLWCWGKADSGQLGTGMTESDSPSQVGSETWQSIAAFGDSACGVTAGRLLCWGQNTHGQLGTGTMGMNATVPVGVLTPDPTANWVSVTGGVAHACALRGTGDLWCFGQNDRGQIGTGGSPSDVLSPMKLDGGPWQSVAAGAEHTCAIDHDGRLWCVGNAADNALGTGDGDALEPHHVEGGYAKPVAGIDVTCATGATGLTCWGSNIGGLLGTGRREDSFVLQRPTGTIGDFEDYSAGDHVCAVRAGQRYCWGENYAGQLGDGTGNYAYSPMQFGPGVWTATSSSNVHTCGLQADGSAWCWGRNAEGEIGNGQSGGGLTVTLPSQIGSPPAWTSIAAGSGFSCGIATDRNVYCWGYTYEGELANHFGMPSQPTPTMIGVASVAYDRLYAGDKHACAIESGGSTARCWGWDLYGQLGDGSSGPSADAFAPEVLPGAWRSFGLGRFHSCGIKTDGSLWCWGNNNHGQLGLGTTVDHPTPQQVGTDVDWNDVVGGTTHACATKGTPAELYCWGSQAVGAVGDGTAWFDALHEVTR